MRGGRCLSYDAHSLADYMRSTGDVRDPVARQPLTEAERGHLARTAGGLPSLDDLSLIYATEVSRREVLRHVEDELLTTPSGPVAVAALHDVRGIATDSEWEAVVARVVRLRGVPPCETRTTERLVGFLLHHVGKDTVSA